MYFYKSVDIVKNAPLLTHEGELRGIFWQLTSLTNVLP